MSEDFNKKEEILRDHIFNYLEKKSKKDSWIFDIKGYPDKLSIRDNNGKIAVLYDLELGVDFFFNKKIADLFGIGMRQTRHIIVDWIINKYPDITVDHVIAEYLNESIKNKKSLIKENDVNVNNDSDIISASISYLSKHNGDGLNPKDMLWAKSILCFIRKNKDNVKVVQKNKDHWVNYINLCKEAIKDVEYVKNTDPLLFNRMVKDGEKLRYGRLWDDGKKIIKIGD